jgi:hypothetical protein
VHVIDLMFRSFEKEPFGSFFGETGVYVLWHPTAEKRPTYLGQGDILARLARHDDWLSRHTTGTVAITSGEGISKHLAKNDAEMAEAILLSVAERIGRSPTKNNAPGNVRKVEKLFESHGVVRLNVTGQHPLRHPGRAGSRIDGRSTITLRGSIENVECPWR